MLRLPTLVLAITVAFGLPHKATSDTTTRRFCAAPVSTSKLLELDSYPTVRKIVQTDDPDNDIFYLGGVSGGQAARLSGFEFIPFAAEHPYPNYVEAMPTGRVLGLVSNRGEREVVSQSKLTGEFQILPLEFEENLSLGHPRTFAGADFIRWSTPMKGALVVTSGPNSWDDTFLVKGNKAIRLTSPGARVNGVWDFPDLNLTILKDKSDNLLAIDAEQNTHEIGQLELEKWHYIQSILRLDNPTRLLVETDEAMGPFSGLYLINLERVDETWRPVKQQDLLNIWDQFQRPNRNFKANLRGAYDAENRRYFFYGRNYVGIPKKRFGLFRTKAVDIEPKLYEVGAAGIVERSRSDIDNPPRRLRLLMALDSAASKTASWMEVKFPSSDMTLRINEKGYKTDRQTSLVISDANGNDFSLDWTQVGQTGTIVVKDAIYLKNHRAILVAEREGYFLILDRETHGPKACDTGPN